MAGKEQQNKNFENRNLYPEKPWFDVVERQYLRVRWWNLAKDWCLAQDWRFLRNLILFSRPRKCVSYIYCTFVLPGSS